MKEADLGRFKLAVEHAYDHIVITDPDGLILYANAAAEQNTGFSFAEMQGKTPRLWGGLMGKEFYTDMWHIIKDLKQPFVGEVVNRRKDNTQYIAELRISSVQEHGNVKFFIGIERDITKLKQIDQAKTEFLSLASHQLRTPMSTLRWYSEVLLSNDLGELNDRQRQYVKEINKASQRLINLVNDLLNVSRIQMGKFLLHYTKLDLAKITDTVLSEHAEMIAEKHLTIVKKYPKHSHAFGDMQLTLITLENLISNAVRYTPYKGTVTISFDITDEFVQITISDTGYGIEMEDYRHIFTKFFRGNNAKKAVPNGTGIGLYIVKSFLDDAGGSIDFTSQINKGTSFTAKLPQHKLGTTNIVHD